MTVQAEYGISVAALTIANFTYGHPCRGISAVQKCCAGTPLDPWRSPTPDGTKPTHTALVISSPLPAQYVQ